MKRKLRYLVHRVRVLNFTRSLPAELGGEIDPQKTLLIPAAAPGGLGDDAMVNASIEAIRELSSDHSISLLVQTNFPQNFTFNNSASYERKLNAWRHPQKEVVSMKQYQHVYLLGADILDGAINLPDSIKRIKMAGLFSQQGQSARIIGFSVNEQPHPEVIKEFGALPRNVLLFLRDPISYKRAKSFIHGDVRLSADVAFLLKPRSTQKTRLTEEFVMNAKKNGDIVVGINVHSMLANFSRQGTMERLLKSIAYLMENTRSSSYVLLPHDYRNTSDDRIPLQTIKDFLPKHAKEKVISLVEQMRADEIKEICGYLDGVLTARMHIAIAALGMGVPVIGIVYQGKFEGTFAHFGLDKELLFEPEEAADKDILKKKFDHWLRTLDTYKILIKERLPYVKHLALKNFQ